MNRMLRLRYVARLLYASWCHANRAAVDLRTRGKPCPSPYELWERALAYLVAPTPRQA